MPKYRLTVETTIEIDANSEDEATERFYDEVYEVDRHGKLTIEEVKP